MNRPVTVSVIIPTFNRVDAAVRAVESALGQTEPPLEVIVCDDASTDGTEARFREWAARDERLRYIRNPRNAGTPAVGRNAGMRAARGDWVAFLDDDDRWLPEKLQVQAPHLAGERIVAANALRSSTSLPYFDPATLAQRPAQLDLWRANPIIQSTAVAPTSLLLAVGGFNEARRLRGIEDYELWLRVVDRGAEVIVIPQPLIDYSDAGDDMRLSSAPARRQAAVASIFARRWLKRPLDRRRAAVAAGQAHTAFNVALDVARRSRGR